MARFLQQPDGTFRLGDFLKHHLSLRKWTHFRAAIAFVKRSGTCHISDGLEEFSERGEVRITVGIDHAGTSREGLVDLLAAVDRRGSLWVFHNEIASTFHPKVYLFRNASKAVLCIGSGNLTGGGLFTNYEASLIRDLSLRNSEDLNLLSSVESALDEWSNPALGLAKELTETLLDQLVSEGYVKPEAEIAAESTKRASRNDSIQSRIRRAIFAKVGVRHAPAVKLPTQKQRYTGRTAGTKAIKKSLEVGFKGFLMTLQQTDVGVGQVTEGASKRSPELFIPLAARDFAPEFWGWDDEFVGDESNPGKMDRRGVRMRLGTGITEVNMMTWPAKHDFRLRSAALRSAGNIGDILRIEKPGTGFAFSYYVEIIPQGTSLYEDFLSLCVNPVKSSKKRWGYY